MKNTKQITFSLSMPVFNKLRELKEVKSINLSALVDKTLMTLLKINKENENEK